VRALIAPAVLIAILTRGLDGERTARTSARVL